jgi:DNA-binding beta-propeller fold protein YncE
VTDDATRTVYVLNAAEGGDAPGTVSVLDSATCNGTRTAGCHRQFPVMATGAMPVVGALDRANHRLYVSDYNNAQVSILNTARCDGEVTSGCRVPPRQQAVGGDPYGIAVNPCRGTGTVYVAQQYLPGAMAVFRA